MLVVTRDMAIKEPRIVEDSDLNCALENLCLCQSRVPNSSMGDAFFLKMLSQLTVVNGVIFQSVDTSCRVD